MVSVSASKAFSGLQYDLDYVFGYFHDDYQVRINQPISIGGKQYGDSVTFFKTGPVAVGGNNFVYDQDDRIVTGGTINALSGSFDYRGLNQGVVIQGLSVSVVDARIAASTLGLADDAVLMQAEFNGADTFKLSNFGDWAAGYGGNDTMYGSSGDDFLYGGTGSDRIAGGQHNDRLEGDAGYDVLNGGSGNDWIYGGAGKDTIYGGDGSDVIEGGSGSDTIVLQRDSDRDVLVIRVLGDSPAGVSRDVVKGFERGADVISVWAIDANTTNRTGNDEFIYSNSRASAHSLWWVRSGDGVSVRADVDGDAKADLGLYIAGTTSLSLDDFVL